LTRAEQNRRKQTRGTETSDALAKTKRKISRGGGARRMGKKKKKKKKRGTRVGPA